MVGFGGKYPALNVRIKKIIGQSESLSHRQAKKLLNESKSRELDLSEVADLLNSGQELDSIRKFTKRNFSGAKQANQLRHIFPIYLSSHCVDKCGYCNFSAVRKDTIRQRLSLQQVQREINAVLSLGGRVIEFTLATDPYFTAETLCEYVTLDKS